MKSLALASKLQVLKNWPVPGWRTALFFEWLKFCRSAEKIFLDRFFVGDRRKNFLEFFLESAVLHLCPWSMTLTSSIPVLGLESVRPRKGCPRPWPRMFFFVLVLEPCVLERSKTAGMTDPRSRPSFGNSI